MKMPSNLLPVLGGVILVSVALYFGFQSVDASGLDDRRGVATVIEKEHKAPEKKYRTDIVAGKTRVIPQYNPEMYLLKLRIGKQESTSAVSRELFDAVQPGDQVAITYRERRLTKALEVTSVRREAK